MVPFFRKSEILEVLAIVFIVIAVALIVPAFHSKAHKRSSHSKCKSNLKQLGIAMQLYVDSRGFKKVDGVGKFSYPPFSGAEFWTHMYRTEVMIDFEVYLCPNTDDDNNDGKALARFGSPAPSACSYGGRINFRGHPARIFTGRNASDTPIGCDDDEGEFNHLEVVNVVFLDNSAKDFIYSDSYIDPQLGGARIGSGILSVCTN